MPVFDTPNPISVDVEIGVGDIRIVASDRSDTVVEVRPSDPTNKTDVAAAERTRVEYTGGRLVVKVPKGLFHYSFKGGDDSVHVEIALPSGSQVRADAAVATLRCSGRLGECRYKAGVGEVQIEDAGPLHVRTGVGDVTADRVLEHLDVTTGSGAIRVMRIDGSAAIKNSNGDTWIGEVTGEARVSAANGGISVDHALAAVAARSANGDIRLEEVARGSVVAHTGFGRVDIGVLDGVAAWLDLDTGFGNVVNDLDATQRPEHGEETVEVRARSGYGDVTIRRAAPSHA